MRSTLDDARLAEAFELAASAFQRIWRLGPGVSDRELARNRDYHDLHRAGMQIALLGGVAAIRAAAEALCNVPQGTRNDASAELDRLWDGMGRWRS